MAYGFRLFYLCMFDGFRSAELDLGEEFAGHEPPDILADALSALTVGQETRWGMPSIRRTADGEEITPQVPSERGDRAIKFLTSSRPGTLHLSAEVAYGSIQGQEFAIRAAGDIDISGAAPSHRHRVEILLPADGTTGLLVVEDVDRSCPGPSVARWISKHSKQASGGTKWVRLVTQGVSDEDRLAELVKNTRKAEIRLKREAKTDDGGRYRSGITVRADIEREEDRRSIISAITRWRSGQKPSNSDTAALLAKIAGVDEIDPDEGDVHIEDASTGRRVSPDRLDDVFIYETGQVRATPDAWKSEVLTRLSVIGGNLRCDVEW